MDGTSNNFLEAEKDDSKRFKKESRNKKKQKLSYENSDEGVRCIFSERWDWYDVHQMELIFIDSAGNRKILRKDDSSFSELNIIFSDWEKILICYKLINEDETKYCSWGYKKHSATTEKLFVYFETQVYTYLVYVDARHPEYFFLFSDCGKSIENLYNFLKSIVREN